MQGGMRFDNDDIRALPLHMQEQVGTALVAQMAQANPVAAPEEREPKEMPMKKCDPRVFARCPYRASCISADQAFFKEGSDCDQFSQKILTIPVTYGDRVRSMSDQELAEWTAEVELNAIKGCIKRQGFELSEDQTTRRHHFLRKKWLQYLRTWPEGTDISELEQESEADMVEVVRCVHCRHRVHDEVIGEDFCNHPAGLCEIVSLNNFCPYGERK